MVLASTPCFLLEGTGADRYRTVGLDKLPYEGDGGSSVLCHWVAAEPQLWEGPGRVLGRGRLQNRRGKHFGSTWSGLSPLPLLCQHRTGVGAGVGLVARTVQ